MVAHEVLVSADGYVLVLTCSCGELREDLTDDELPLAAVIRAAEAHRAGAVVQEEAFAHAGLGHWTRTRFEPRVGPVIRCSCGAAWSVPA